MCIAHYIKGLCPYYQLNVLFYNFKVNPIMVVLYLGVFLHSNSVILYRIEIGYIE